MRKTLQKLIFNVNEDFIEVSQASVYPKYVKINRVVNFTPVYEGNKAVFNSEANAASMKNLLKNCHIKGKKVKVILSIDGLITRLVELPYLKLNDLRSYVKNNIEQYFTVNMDDYFFDFKIVEIIKKEKNFLNVLLVAVPKDRFKDIAEFVKTIGLSLVSVSIYPECVSNLFRNYSNKSIAVLDAGNKKSSITVLDNGKLFVYSPLSIDLSEEENYNELLDNLNYFLNFYSSRHFGNKIDKVFVTGEYSAVDSFMLFLNSNMEGTVDNELKGLGLMLSPGKNLELENYIEICGGAAFVRNIFNKKIDFKDEIRIKKKDDQSMARIALIGAALLMAAIFWYSYKIYSLNIQIKKYNVAANNANSAALDKEIGDISKHNQEYTSSVDYVNQIKSDEFDYISILDTIKKGLPKNITVNSIDLDKQTATLKLNIENSTIDVAKAVIAVNNMDIFEECDISEVKLDDSVNSLTLSLKLKNPN